MHVGTYLVQHWLGHMVVEYLGWSIPVAIFGADICANHDQDAGAIRVTEVARLGRYWELPGQRR